MGRPLPLFLVVCEKVVSAALLAVAAAAALIIHQRAAANPVAALLPGEWNEDPRDLLVRWMAVHAPQLSPHHYIWIGLGLAVWALLFAVEAVGLWRGIPWAEVLVIVETAAFLPYELWRLAVRPDATGLVSLSVNVAILVYITRLYRRSRAYSRAELSSPIPWRRKKSSR